MMHALRDSRLSRQTFWKQPTLPDQMRVKMSVIASAKSSNFTWNRGKDDQWNVLTLLTDPPESLRWT